MGGIEPGRPNCSARRSNCQYSSLAIYTLEIIGCGSAAAGVGAGTLGLGGVAVYTLCAGAALVHYNTMMNDCTYAYQDCINPPNYN